MHDDLQPQVLARVLDAIACFRVEFTNCRDQRCLHPRYTHFDHGHLCCSFPVNVCPCAKFIGISEGVYDAQRSLSLRATIGR
jgi:hypothetical protein